MIEITTVGLDLAKRVVSLCGEDASGRAVVQRTLRREAVLAWFAQRPPCLVGMEACSSAHWFARELAALGHTVRIIAPEFVRPFRLSGKNDTNDAAAVCAAVRQPQLRFVTVKSAEQQARLVVHPPGLAGGTHGQPQPPAWTAGGVWPGLSEQRDGGAHRGSLGPCRRRAASSTAPWGSAATRSSARTRPVYRRVRPRDRAGCRRRSACAAGGTLERRGRAHR